MLLAQLQELEGKVQSLEPQAEESSQVGLHPVLCCAMPCCTAALCPVPCSVPVVLCAHSTTAVCSTVQSHYISLGNMHPWSPFLVSLLFTGAALPIMFLVVLQANEPLSLAATDSVSPEDPEAGNLKVSTPGGSWDDGWDVVGPVRSPRRSTIVEGAGLEGLSLMVEFTCCVLVCNCEVAAVAVPMWTVAIHTALYLCVPAERLQ